MARLEGLRIVNYRTLKNISLGRIWDSPESAPLTPLSVVIGKNGVGKSTLFDAFGFLADCLKVGVEEACDMRGRGGFARLRSQGETGPITFEVYYREDAHSPLVLYAIFINMDNEGRPYVLGEWLGQQALPSSAASLFLTLNKGKGEAYKSGDKNSEAEKIQLSDNRKLGIATLGSLMQHPRIAAFYKFIEGWYLSYFTPDAARGLPLAGPQKHLNLHGDNLGNVVQFMEREHRGEFNSILARIAQRIPGINTISTEKTPDGRLLLRFNDKGFQDPFYAPQMSDGTLKIFAYLLLLEDPTPPPFLCIEEPENGLYHKLLETLVAEFRDHAGRGGGSQVFITTHQPYLVDALTPEEVWVLEKGENGFATIVRASDIPYIKELVAEGLPLGGLWYSDYLDAR